MAPFLWATTEQRGARGRRLLDDYAAEVGAPNEEDRTLTVDLLADLMHTLPEIDWAALVADARVHYLVEAKG